MLSLKVPMLHKLHNAFGCPLLQCVQCSLVQILSIHCMSSEGLKGFHIKVDVSVICCHRVSVLIATNVNILEN